MIRRALVSVSDKRGIVELGKALAQAGVEILSTGGTAASLASAGGGPGRNCDGEASANGFIVAASYPMGNTVGT